MPTPLTSLSAFNAIFLEKRSPTHVVHRVFLCGEKTFLLDCELWTLTSSYLSSVLAVHSEMHWVSSCSLRNGANG